MICRGHACVSRTTIREIFFHLYNPTWKNMKKIKIKYENSDFFERVYTIVRQIPKGKVTTYGVIAKTLGLKSSARMVGWALNALAGGTNSDIPAHRVVNRLGELTGKFYFCTPNLMKELLLSESIEFKGDAVDMREHLWEPEYETCNFEL